MISRYIKRISLLFHYMDSKKFFSQRQIHMINFNCMQLCHQHFKGFTTSIEPKVKKKKAENQSGKVNLVRLLNFKNSEDALPFYKLSFKTLLKIYNTTKLDEKQGFCSNRVYFIAEKIKVKPSILSEKISKRTFIYSLSFDWLESSLNVLIEFGVPAERLLKDLWVLKYHHETIRHRLQRVKHFGRDDLYPWMVRCNEDVLNRSIKISIDAKTILGDIKSLQSYLAYRLDTTEDVIEDIFQKLPVMKTMRVTKAKEFIDYLLNEGFSKQEIIHKPRVLLSSIKTIKKRLALLRALHVECINLNILCRPRKAFKKYYNTLCTVME